MKDIQLLIKKDNLLGKYTNIYPKTYTDAIIDKESGKSLHDILLSFNMYFLNYTGNTATTRLKVPAIVRKKGLWITYVKYDNNVYTEWYAGELTDDTSWQNSSNWRVGNNSLVGDITISSNGNWIVNGIETEFKAIGESGISPILRIQNNKLLVSYNQGTSYTNISDTPIYTRFRWLATTGDTQANNVGRIQASTDEGKTWTNMSNDFTNNLHIKKYIGVNESLPTSGIAEGTIYAKGPTYDESDTSNSNPIYRLWIYAWKGNTLAWQDNGEFTSISAGVVQKTGNSETNVMSQKATSEAIHGLEEEINSLSKVTGITFDYQDSYINTDGTISGSGTVKWWITGYVSILPNTRIKGKIYTITGALCVAFYDKDKKFISGIQSDSSSYEWKEIDAVAPSNAYYVVGCSRASDIPNCDSIIFTIPPLGFNKAARWDEMTGKIKTFVVDANPEFESFKLKSPNTNDRTIVVNSYNSDASQYSNLLFMHPRGYVNLRATNVELRNNDVLFLSKSSSSLQRYSSVDELPSTGPSADVYLFPESIASFRDLSWDCVCYNVDGHLINLLFGNISLAGDGFPTTEDLKKGLFLPQTFDKNGYLDVDGKFNSTTAWSSTDYIKVRGGERIIGTVFGAENATCLVAYYDEYFNTLGTIKSTIPSSGGEESFNAIIPKNVRNIRFCSKAGKVALAYIGARILVNDDDRYKYGHNLKKPYDFNGKTAVFFGDSVTNGVASQGDTIVGITECYRKVFCDEAGLVGINKAISGSCLYWPDYDGSTPNEDSILSQVRKTITANTAADFDFVIIAGGINDFWTGKNLGTLEDEGNVSVYGALKAICEHLKANTPNAKVIFLTPINYSKMQKATPYLPLSHYRNAIFEVATMNGYSVVDMSIVGFPNEPTNTPYKAAMITDGVHPTELGHKMMGDMLYSILS